MASVIATGKPAFIQRSTPLSTPPASFSVAQRKTSFGTEVAGESTREDLLAALRERKAEYERVLADPALREGRYVRQYYPNGLENAKLAIRKLEAGLFDPYNPEDRTQAIRARYPDKRGDDLQRKVLVQGSPESLEFTKEQAEERRPTTTTTAAPVGLTATEYSGLNPAAKAAVLAQSKKYGTVVPIQGTGYVIGGRIYAQPRTQEGVAFLKEKAVTAGAAPYIAQRTKEAEALKARGYPTAGAALRALQGRPQAAQQQPRQATFYAPPAQPGPLVPSSFAGQQVTAERNDPIRFAPQPIPMAPARLEATPRKSLRVPGTGVFLSTESEKLYGMAGRDFEKVKGFTGSLKTEVPSLKETGAAAVALGTGTARYFAGGVRESITAIGQNPVEATATFGLYAGSYALFGPAGPAGLFATQNVLEASTGQKPSVVALAENPIRGAGQLAPYAAAGAGLNLAYSEARGAALTRQYEGQIAQGVKDLPSTDILVEPVEAYQVRSQSVTRAGATARFTTGTPVKGEPYWTTGEEIANAPKNFIVEAQLQRFDVARPVSVRPTTTSPVIDVKLGAKPRYTTVEEPVTAPSTTMPFSTGLEVTRTGLMSAEQLQASLEPSATFTVTPSRLAPTLVGGSLGEGTVRFQGVDLATTTEVATRGFQTGGAKASPKAPPGPEQIYAPGLYGPQIDYFKEFFSAEGGGGSLTIRESTATGKLLVERTGPPPLIIKKITPSTTSSSAALSAGAAGEGVTATAAGDQLLLLKQKAKPKPIILTVEEQKAQAVQKAETAQVTVKEPKAATTTASKSLSDVLGPQRRTRAYIRVGPEQRLGVLLGPLQGARSLAGSSSVTGVTAAQLSAQLAGQQAGQLSAQQAGQQAGQLSVQQAAQATTSTTITATAQQSLFSSQRARPPEEVTRKIFTPPRTFADEKKPGGALFSVEVRRRGRFERVASQPVGFAQAFARGRAVVERTAAASFRIIPERGTEPARRSFPLPATFRESKKERGVFIQRSRFRISSPGEKSEITFKGIAASRGRSVFSRAFGGRRR